MLAVGQMTMELYTFGMSKEMKEPIPYIAYEGALARMERTIKRLWILCLVMFLAFVISNGAWIYYESQFAVQQDTTTIDAMQGDGINIVSGGDTNYGAESKDN